MITYQQLELQDLLDRYIDRGRAIELERELERRHRFAEDYEPEEDES